jgi:nitrogen fixation/metabolism regulation signal transduction histidine kinase
MLLLSLAALLRDRRDGVPGSRLKLRLLVAFAAITAAPLLVVFLVAVQFLHRGIETWADDNIAAEIDRSLQLSRSALNKVLEAELDRSRRAAARLAGMGTAEMAAIMPAVRRAAGAREMTVFAGDFRVIATSSEGRSNRVPERPGEEVMQELPARGTYVALEPRGHDRLHIRTALTMKGSKDLAGESLTLQAFYPVRGGLGALAESVQKIYTRYGESVFLREPLESSFTVALAVVVLLALFAALYGAFMFAQRLAEPIRRLVAGTRAVAAGNLHTHLPVTSHDDIGSLVESFNEMTARLAAAGDQARRNAEEIEAARASLATVLARLTSGVIAIDSSRQLRMANEAAGTILHADMGPFTGHAITQVCGQHPLLDRFFEFCEERSRVSPAGWREQMTLAGEGAGQRILMCSAAPLPDEQGTGYVLVFDDITAMLQAQRDAAWGEVARRLAHEIKNPLTPIQLSAERIRRRYLGNLEGAEAELMDRATHTIVQQVEALRDMVNAFSEYARAPEISFTWLDLNGLVREVADLYHGPQGPEMRLDLAADVAGIEADAVRLRQLMHNLIRNACEALEGVSGGVVTVSTRPVEQNGEPYAEIRVQDNGPGIDPDLREQIFEPYVTSKTRGTGLGLAIVRRLVEEHGGSVTAENPPGGGACVTALLPVTQRSREASAESRPRRAG